MAPYSQRQRRQSPRQLVADESKSHFKKSWQTDRPKVRFSTGAVEMVRDTGFEPVNRHLVVDNQWFVATIREMGTA